MATTIPAGEFKAKCLKLLDRSLRSVRPGDHQARQAGGAGDTDPAKREYVVGSMKVAYCGMGDIISPIDVNGMR